MSIKTEVITLEAIDNTFYSVIGAMIIHDKAKKRLTKYNTSAANQVFSLGVLLVNSYPDLQAFQIHSIFESEFKNAMAQHIKDGHIGPDYETKNKNIVTAFHKVSNAFKKNFDIVDLGSTNACADAVAKANQEASEAQDLAIIEESIVKSAKEKGITEDEARLALAPKPRDNSGAVAPTNNGSASDTPSPKSSNDDGVGKVSEPTSSILPDSNLDIAKLRLLIDNLNDILAVNPGQANDMLTSMVAKSKKVKESLVNHLVKHAVSK